MHFARSEYLYLLLILPMLGLFFSWSFYRRRKRLAMFVSRKLSDRLTPDFSRGKAAFRALLLTAFFLFGILALARPQWGMRLNTVRRQGVDIIAALDTSYSMNAEDIAPSRLAKAKNEIRGLIGRLKGDRIGLVVFAGTAIVQCPLTLDYGAALLFLDAANTEMIPEPGTSLAAAIQTADSAFIAKERKYKVLVIFTDGEDLEGQIGEAVAKARDEGVIIYTVGIGSPEGKPLPERDAKGDIVAYRKNQDGQVVISRLDEQSLREIASKTNGAYFRATTSESELDQLYDDVSRMETRPLESRVVQTFEDQFQYPLGAALLCLIAEAWLSERRKPGRGWMARIYSRTRPAAGDV